MFVDAPRRGLRPIACHGAARAAASVVRSGSGSAFCKPDDTPQLGTITTSGGRRYGASRRRPGLRQTRSAAPRACAARTGRLLFLSCLVRASAARSAARCRSSLECRVASSEERAAAMSAATAEPLWRLRRFDVARRQCCRGDVALDLCGPPAFCWLRMHPRSKPDARVGDGRSFASVDVLRSR